MQTVRTQDIPQAENRTDFYALDPDFVTQPYGRMAITLPVAIGLGLLRVYLLLVAGIVVFRFVQYAHWVK